ncbi:MAG: DUF192 domain-containing protein [Parasphingorhabdus sp.]|uniref:DUF192 domain-containing protein n=1 Tax=Parasphingorhabdus sp. TaxID=2709688 RepID=UPI003299990F
MKIVHNLTRWAFMPLVYCALAACSAQAGDARGNAAGENSSQDKRSPAGLRLIPLTIQSKDKTHNFTVELAATQEEQAQGLMFRTELAPDMGMIFPFDRERMGSFWMKNTVIPLDIIFIRKDGSIESIAANTVPYSLDPVQSGEPVAAVLELAGGRAAQLAIEPGDKVNWNE